MARTERLLLILALSVGLWVFARAAAPEPLESLSSPALSTPMLVEPDFAGAKKATMRFEHGEGVCSATAIDDNDGEPGSHRVLTAAHCVEVDALSAVGIHVADPAKLTGLRLGTRWANVTKVEFDGHDAAILTTDLYFTDVARFGHKPKQGAVVFSHGNPAGVPDILVVGRIAGWVDTYFDAKNVMVVDFNAWYGCSGAAVFDEQGRVVGIVNALWPWPQKGWRMTAVLPIDFPEAAITRE